MQESMLEEFVQYRFRSALTEGSEFLQKLRDEVNGWIHELNRPEEGNRKALIAGSGAADNVVVMGEDASAGRIKGKNDIRITDIDCDEGKGGHGHPGVKGTRPHAGAVTRDQAPVITVANVATDKNTQEIVSAQRLEQVLAAMQRALERALAKNRQYLRANLQESARTGSGGGKRVTAAVMEAMAAAKAVPKRKSEKSQKDKTG